MIMMLFLIPVTSFAKDNTGAGTLPGSFFYFLDRGVEEISVIFTFNKTAKERIINKIEEERKAEQKVLELKSGKFSNEINQTQFPIKNQEDTDKIVEPTKLIPENKNESSEINVKPVVDPAPIKNKEEDKVKETKPIEVRPIEVKPIPTNVNEIKPDSNRTPRIMYWWGKVNQHFNVNTGLWETDPDGVSGANLDMKTYCKKWYPETKSIKEYKYETIYNWKDRGNVSNYVSTRLSYECVTKEVTQNEDSDDVKPTEATDPIKDPVKPIDDNQDEVNTVDGNQDKTKQIMYWWGKVNLHLENNIWTTDPDGTSGANLDKLTYCKKWYPGTVSFKENELTFSDAWRNAGNTSSFTAIKMSYYCIQS